MGSRQEEVARSVIEGYDELISSPAYSVILGNETWYIHAESLNIVQASDLAYRVKKHLPNSYPVEIIPDEFGLIVSGNSVEDISFGDGTVCIARYSKGKTQPTVNFHVISGRKQYTSSSWLLWNELGLKNITA